ncbi:MAG: hypothetical protein ABIT70_05720 [Sulfuriferula sp.]
MSKDQKNMKWPDGYCLDPDGNMCPPAGKEDDFNFGYENGFQDAWEIMNTAVRARDKARFEAANV